MIGWTSAHPIVKTLRLTLTALALSALLTTQGQAQSSGSSSLTLGLFERYLDALRLEFGVPGLSAVVVEDGRPLEEVLAKRSTLAEDMLALYNGRWQQSVEPVFADYQY